MGGLASPTREEEPPLLVRCTFIVTNLFFPSSVSHAAASGFRLASHASFPGSIKPGLYFSSPFGRISFASVLDPGFRLRNWITEAS